MVPPHRHKLSHIILLEVKDVTKVDFSAFVSSDTSRFYTLIIEVNK